MSEEFKIELLQKLKDTKERITKEADKHAKLCSIASFKQPRNIIAVSIISSLLVGSIFLIAGIYATGLLKCSFAMLQTISAVLGGLIGTGLTILLVKAKNSPDLVLNKNAKTVSDFLVLEVEHEIKAMLNYAKIDVIELIESQLADDKNNAIPSQKTKDEIRQQIFSTTKELKALKKRQKELVVKYVLIQKFKKLIKKEKSGKLSSDVLGESMTSKQQAYSRLREEYADIDFSNENVSRLRLLNEIDTITKKIAKNMLSLKILERDYHSLNKEVDQKVTQTVKKFHSKRKKY